MQHAGLGRSTRREVRAGHVAEALAPPSGEYGEAGQLRRRRARLCHVLAALQGGEAAREAAADRATAERAQPRCEARVLLLVRRVVVACWPSTRRSFPGPFPFSNSPFSQFAVLHSPFIRRSFGFLQLAVNSP